MAHLLGAENLGLLANELDIPYVYISTAGIFDGEQETYNDFDTPAPLGFYAKSKAHGERWTLAEMTPGSRTPPRRTNVVFTDLKEAEWHVFKLRWATLAGEELPLE